MKEVKFYACAHCGNVAHKLTDSGVSVVCCGEKMRELVANTVDASKEKHVPVITREGDKVRAFVGAVVHPMLKEHSIQWIAVAHGDCLDIKYLSPSSDPAAVFTVQESAFTVYEYCNLHGLWAAEQR